MRQWPKSTPVTSKKRIPDRDRPLRFRHFNSWNGLALIVLTLLSTPLLVIVLRLFAPPSEQGYHVLRHLLGEYVINTTIVLTGVGIATLLLGSTTAWFVSAFDFPGRRHWEWLLILPLGFPGYIMAYCYTGMLGYSGMVATWLRNTAGIETGVSLIDLMNRPGTIFILTLSLFPYVYLIARSAFLHRSTSLQESSSLLGMGRWKTFFKVVLPLSRPALAAGVALALMEVLNDYGVAHYFGVNTLTTGIFRSWFSMGDVGIAVYLAAILLVFVFGLLYMENRQRGQRRFEGGATMGSRPAIREKAATGTGWIMSFFCGLVVLLGFVLPFLQLVLWTRLTFAQVVDMRFFILVARSFGLAAISALIITSTALMLLYAERVSLLPWICQITRASTLGYAIPGAVIAIGVMIFVQRIDQVFDTVFASRSYLSGTLTVLVFAYTVRFLAVAYHPIAAGFAKTGKSVHEASELLGANHWKTLWQIDFPLVRSSCLAGMLLVFVDVLKELPLTLILRPFNYHTLATQAFDMATNEMVAESANAALIITITGILPILFLNRLIQSPPV